MYPISFTKYLEKMIKFKKYIPSSLKAILWQYFLYRKHSRNNSIGKHVVISKDFICGHNCKISDGAVIGKEVVLGNSVEIGKRALISKAQIGNQSFIESNVIFTGYGKGHIKIGNESYIGLYNVLDWSSDLIIGNYVHIAGPSTGIWTHSSTKMCLNGISLNEKSELFRPTAPVHIEDNVWIGGNCTIYPGVHIGRHSIVSPNSAVTKDVQPYSMVGGVPARVIKIIEM